MFCAVFSRGHATLYLAVSVRMSVYPSVTFLNSELFLHYCSCPTVRDWIAGLVFLAQTKVAVEVNSSNADADTVLLGDKTCRT